MTGPNKFYAVARGRNPGIYTQWFGETGAEAQINGFPRARFKGFTTLDEAREWLDTFDDREKLTPARVPKNRQVDLPFGKIRLPVSDKNGSPSKTKGSEEIFIYTDGACTGNPGPGGYGTVILDGENRVELSGGYRMTTNNRMELTAIIQGLASLKTPSRVRLYSDSKYVVDAITKGWARKWRSRGWVKHDGIPAKNPDLWARLLDLLEFHDVNLIWVKGHAGNIENERCDQLAVAAARRPLLPPDPGYEHPQD
jgi:ribonuclease HI